MFQEDRNGGDVTERLMSTESFSDTSLFLPIRPTMQALRFKKFTVKGTMRTCSRRGKGNTHRPRRYRDALNATESDSCLVSSGLVRIAERNGMRNFFSSHFAVGKGAG